MKTTRLIDSRLDFSTEPSYSVVVGSKQHNFQLVGANSVSNSSLAFTSITVPSLHTVVSRRIVLQTTVQLAITCQNPTVGAPLLNIGSTDAPASFPIHRTCNTLQMSINGASTSLQMRSLFPALKYLGGDEIQEECDSTPSYFDQAASYDSLVGSARNPLGGALVSDSKFHRGAYCLSISNNTCAAANTPQVVYLTFNVAEPIMISPLQYRKISQGMLGVQTMSFNFSMGDPSRMLSHSNVAGTTISAVTGGSGPGNTTLFSNPQLVLEYLVPSGLLEMPKSISLPFHEVVGYQSGQTTITSQQVSLSSGSFQLKSVPNMVLIFAKQPDSSEGVTSPDACFGCRQVGITFDNNVGVLSTAPPSALWEMSKRNGISKDWLDWYGVAGGGAAAGTAGGVLYTTGSVVALEFGTDIPLSEGLAPGVGGSFQFSANGVWDVLGSALNSTVQAQLTCVFIFEGEITLADGVATPSAGLLTQDQVADAKTGPSISYEGAEASGAGLFDSIGSLWNKHKDKVMAGVALAKQGYDAYKNATGGALTYVRGDSGVYGGSSSGGSMSGGKLARRLK